MVHELDFDGWMGQVKMGKQHFKCRKHHKQQNRKSNGWSQVGQRAGSYKAGRESAGQVGWIRIVRKLNTKLRNCNEFVKQ